MVMMILQLGHRQSVAPSPSHGGSSSDGASIFVGFDDFHACLWSRTMKDFNMSSPSITECRESDRSRSSLRSFSGGAGNHVHLPLMLSSSARSLHHASSTNISL
ncbi:hypothetical protein EUGRSUZ_C03855 [Eucalyptus grandis]|uniref:Uncharacterized protein n=2 Tax=Eucalyptus grandis TaxID=71139 RepID=A0ACC3LK48_EUCGR|nr:hypothetical protein EUGRSUZ_C03855 [Eucalyptus grandis]